MKTVSFVLAALLCTLGSTAFAQVTVKDAWIRATVPAQTSTGAFMQITSAQDARLVAASSPAAGIVGVHEMKMEGSTMKMAPLAGGLELPAGKPVTLKPGSFHIMMQELKAPIKAGDSVPVTLVVEDKNHQRQNVEVKITAQPLNATGPAKGGMADMPGMSGMSGDHSMHK